jgi:type I restriction enzyme S subunit
MKDIRDGRVLLHNIATTVVTDSELQAYRLHRGDLLINRTNSLDQVGKVGIVDADREIVFASYLVRLVVDRSKIEPEFLNLWLNSNIAQRTIKRIATPAVGQANLNPTEFQKYCLVPLPPKTEQRRITELFRTWDEAIEKTERLNALALTRFRGAQQRLFGDTAMKGEGWTTSSLARIADRVRRKSDGAKHPIMTISGKSGFLRQDEKFSRFMAGESVENYTLLNEGEFAYNKGNSKTYPQGCVYRLEQKTALVPHVYISFRLHSGLNSDFYAHLFQSGFLNRQLARLINSGVRNDGLLNLNIDDFFGCAVPVPPLDQQGRIANLFEIAKRELTILEGQIRRLRCQKRGLMQKLLTGEWRVPLHDRKVEQLAEGAVEEITP